MQAVFMDITPDILPTNLCKRWVFNNSGKQTIAKKMKADLDETIENLDVNLEVITESPTLKPEMPVPTQAEMEKF